MPEVAEAPEEVVDIPASEKVAINRMADKFKDAMKGLKTPPPAAIAPVETPKPAEAPKPAPAAPAPAPAEAPKPAEPAQQNGEAAIPEIPKTHKDWKALKEVKDKYQKDYETLKPQFDSLTAEKSAAIAERDQIKAELAEAKKGTAEHAELKAEYEKAKQFVDEFYVERSPQFQSHFGQRLQAAKMEAAKAVGPEHADKIKAAFEIPASKYRYEQVKAIGLELDDYDRAALVRAYGNLEDTERDREAELAKAPENRKKLAELEAKQQQERAAQDTTQRNAVWAKVIAQIDPELIGYAEADTIKTAAKRVIYREGGPDEFVSVVSDAARWRRHKSSLVEKDERIAKLEGQLAEMQASNPTVQSTVASPAKKSPPPLDNSDVGATFHKAMGRKQ